MKPTSEGGGPKRKTLRSRGAVDKAVVAGVKDRGTNRIVPRVDRGHGRSDATGLCLGHTEPGATVFTDEHNGYRGFGRDFDHEVINHGVGEYVRGVTHTNGMPAR